IGCKPPSRRNSRSCSTRRTFAWAAGVISLTSSRNSTPPAANSICPGFARCAPVNAPRSNPNSSDSSSDSGSAAQLIATNGPRRRGEARWMNRPTTSFPTPDSPCRHVVVSVAATWIAFLSTSHHAADRAAGETDVVEELLGTQFACVPVRGTTCGGVVTRVSDAHNRAHHIPQSRGRTHDRLLLLLKDLPIGLAVGIEATAFALFPVGLEFRRRDVPVRTPFPQHHTQVLSKLFDRRSAKKPVAVVDLEHQKTGFEDNDMRNHGIVLRVRVLGDVEILLDLASRIGQERPMSAHACAVLIRRQHVVGTDGNQPGVTDFHLAIQVDQPLSLAQILRTVSSPAQHQNHRIRTL